MNIFTIVDQNDSQPMVDTHYYKWLVANNIEDVHTIGTKTLYLTEQGFIKGVNKLTETDLRRLKYIEEHYSFIKRQK